MCLFRTLLLGLMALVVLISAGCTQKLIYNNLDWLMAREIEQRVSLNDEQKEALDAILEQRLAWHCSSQIPAYTRTLDQLATLMSTQDIKPAAIESLFQSLEDHWQALAQAMVEDLGPLAATLSSDQLRELEQNLVDEETEWREEYMEQSAEERQAQRVDDMNDRVDSSYGDLNDEQRSAIEQWAVQLQPNLMAMQIERERRRKEFLAELRKPQATADSASAALRQFLLDVDDGADPTYRKQEADNRRKTVDLLVALQQLTSAEQRQHAVDRSQMLRSDIGSLSCNTG